MKKNPEVRAVSVVRKLCKVGYAKARRCLDLLHGEENINQKKRTAKNSNRNSTNKNKRKNEKGKNKPEMNEEEAAQLANDPIYPKSKEDIELEKRVKYWRTKIPAVLVGCAVTLLSFTSSFWSCNVFLLVRV